MIKTHPRLIDFFNVNIVGCPYGKRSYGTQGESTISAFAIQNFSRERELNCHLEE